MPTMVIGIVTNLIHIITLAETVRYERLAWKDRQKWERLIFASLRRIWSRLNKLFPGSKQPQTIGYIQELNPLGIGNSQNTDGPECSAGPPVSAVSVNGAEESRELIRRFRRIPFSTFGIELPNNSEHWEGGTCTEAQNWLTLIPMLLHGQERRFFISSTFMVNDIWRKREAIDLFQSVKPFCGNCCALAESLKTHGLYIKDGAGNPSPEDLKEWCRLCFGDPVPKRDNMRGIQLEGPMGGDGGTAGAIIENEEEGVGRGASTHVDQPEQHDLHLGKSRPKSQGC